MNLAEHILTDKGEERWRSVVGYEEYYEVSSWGKVRRLQSRNGRKVGTFLTLTARKDGYLQVALGSHGKVKTRLVHQVVMEAFHGACPRGMEVNHRHPDGDKSRNWLSNLEYVTSSVNNADQRQHRPAKYLRGDKHFKSKLAEIEIPNIRARIAAGETFTAIGKDYGVVAGTISAIAHGLSRRNQ